MVGNRYTANFCDNYIPSFFGWALQVPYLQNKVNWDNWGNWGEWGK